MHCKALEQEEQAVRSRISVACVRQRIVSDEKSLIRSGAFLCGLTLSQKAPKGKAPTRSVRCSQARGGKWPQGKSRRALAVWISVQLHTLVPPTRQCRGNTFGTSDRVPGPFHIFISCSHRCAHYLRRNSYAIDGLAERNARCASTVAARALFLLHRRLTDRHVHRAR